MYKAIAQNALITFISRVLGFIRDILLSRYVGASWQMDAFLMVFKLPNFFRRLFAEGAFTQSLLPAVVRSSHSEQLMRQVFGGLLLVVLLVSLPFIVFPKQMLLVFIFGLDENSQQFIAAEKMLPWVFPYLGCMACCGFYTVQLSLKKHYMVSSALPIILNVCLIAGGMHYYISHHIVYLAYAVFLSGIIQVAVCLFAVQRVTGVLWPSNMVMTTEVKHMLKQAASAFLAQVITYLSSMLDLLFVSFLVSGSLSWLYYAERLALLPVGVISVVLANIILPDLSVACKEGDTMKAGRLLQRSTNILVILSLPCMVGGFFMAEDILTLLFSSERFGLADVVNTAYSFKVLCLAMPAMMLNKVYMSVPYAMAKSQKQLKIALSGFSVSAITTLFIIKWAGHVALSLGTLVNAWLTFALFGRLIVTELKTPIIDTAMLQRALTAALLMFGGLWAIKDYGDTSTRYALLASIAIKGSMAVALYAFVLWRSNCRRYLVE